MKLYHVAGTAAPWKGTQGEAISTAKAEGLIWEQAEVPTDKPGLLDWLNARAMPVAPPPAAAADAEPEPMPAPKPAPVDHNRQFANATLDRIAVEEFVHAADHAALAVISAAVIWRMRELAKAAGLQS